jgi:hypothetical protein
MVLNSDKTMELTLSNISKMSPHMDLQEAKMTVNMWSKESCLKKVLNIQNGETITNPIDSKIKMFLRNSRSEFMTRSSPKLLPS